MLKIHKQHIIKLCHKDNTHAPVLFLAQKHSFFSDSQSPYSIYGSLPILKNNCISALKCVVVMAVDWLFISKDNLLSACAQKVHKPSFMRSLKNIQVSYELVVQTFYSGLIPRIIDHLTPLNPVLYTSSTEPIITIYLKKEV